MMISHLIILLFFPTKTISAPHTKCPPYILQKILSQKEGGWVSLFSGWKKLNIFSPASYDSFQQHSLKKKKKFHSDKPSCCEGFFNCKIMRKTEENDAITKKDNHWKINTHTKYRYNFIFQDLGYHFAIYFYLSIGLFAPCHQMSLKMNNNKIPTAYWVLPFTKH